jgi:hypothetical protein
MLGLTSKVQAISRTRKALCDVSGRQQMKEKIKT